MMASQIKTIIKKNLLVSIRNRELFIEAILPIVIALMLSLRKQLTALNQLTPLLYCLAITAPQRSVLISLVEEKSKRYKELQKIMGMSSKAYQVGWILTGYIRIIISMIIFQGAYYFFLYVCDTVWDDYFTCSFLNLLWVFVIFGFAVTLANISKAMNQIFLLSSLVNDSKMAGEIQSFLSVAMDFFIYFAFVEKVAESHAFYIIISIISPQCGVAFSYIAAMKASTTETNIVNVNLFPVDVINSTYPPEMAGLTLSILMVLYFVLYLYADQVVPNEYGVAKHPLFFLKRTKFEYVKVQEDILVNYSGDSQDQSSAQYHEELAIRAAPSISITQLTKKFGPNFKAVDRLTLSLYESQIFCLLGHNGAGKTTAINLLTGMIQKSSGKVIMYNMDLDYQLELIRKSLGLCNQKDCLYPELTVLEHLLFIEGIKGNESTHDHYEILRKTDLLEEKDKKASELAGGARRKLSLAMALVGNSKIIFLDEPTSGLDAFSRRQIWEILERIKADKRTIILTTHHLDEAEVLADRIGIMSRGQLLAVGTSDFIKRKFGEGYRLCLKIPSNKQRQAVFDLVTQSVSAAQFEQEYSSDSQLVFTVPFSKQRDLSKLFFKLEADGINISLTMNTLEDAFIKIGTEEEEEADVTQNEEKKNFIASQDLPACLRNPPKYVFAQQVLAIFLRRYYSVIRTNTNYFAILIPIMTFLLGMTTVAYIDLRELFKQYENIDIAIEFFRVSLLSSCTVLAFCFNATIYITLPVQEKESYLKQALHGMGCRMLPYWLGNFLFDYIIYSFYILFFYAFSAIVDLDVSFKYWKVGLISFICFGQCQILMAYIMGFVFNTLETALKMYAIFCFFIQFCLPFVFVGGLDYVYQTLDNPDSIKYAIYAVQILFASIFPQYAFFEAFTFMSGQFEKIGNNYQTPQVSSNSFLFCYIMLGQGVIACIILWILEKGRTVKLGQAPHKQEKNQKLNQQFAEKDIQDEYNRVMLRDTDDPIQAIVLEKEYLPGQGTLQKITFGVKQGEIFGIIGPNGAGKSTLINSFAGIISPTRGQALLNGYEPRNQKMDIMQHVGICPQFDCIWENLTPLEHLRLFGRIKGLIGADLDGTVDYFIETMQLGLFRNTKAGQLSGGNKRKLCVADALIGGSDITFFDEPSTGVDPISRRFLFNTLKRNVQLRNCSAIMTTHTIEEAESLSQRIGILIAGEFKCLGSPEYLRKKYGSGYQITIKLKENSDQSALEASILNESRMNLKRIEDKRVNFTTFQVDEKDFSFSKTFSYFEKLKDRHMIEDFQINESSLEQVFILFSKIQQELNEKAGIVFD